MDPGWQNAGLPGRSAGNPATTVSMSDKLPARGERFEDIAGLGFRLLPEACCCFSREGFDRKQRDELGLCRREQDLEDLKQKIGRRGPLREAVDTL